MDNCYPECHCIPIKLLKQIQKAKKILFELDLQQSQIIHMTNLKILASQLTILHLNSNQIVDLNGIQYLPQLIYLDVSFNKIKSLVQLNGLINLQTLRVTQNQIKNFDVSNLPSIELIDLSYNQVQIDDTFIRNIQQLNSLKAFNFLSNQTKNYETTLQELCPQLEILDGISIYQEQQNNQKQSMELVRIINIQEQQLCEKYNLNDYSLLQKWREAVYKQLVNNSSQNLIYKDTLVFIKQQFLDKYITNTQSQTKKINEKIIQLQNLKKVVIQLYQREKTKNIQDLRKSQEMVQLVCKSFNENCIEIPETKKDCQQVIKDKLKQFSQGNEKFKKQIDELKMQNYLAQQDILTKNNQIEQLTIDNGNKLFKYLLLERYIQEINDREQYFKNLESERQKSLQDMYAKMRAIQEEKMKLQMQLSRQSENKVFEENEIRSNYEIQLQNLQCELELANQKIQLQNDEMKKRMLQNQQSGDERMKQIQMEHRKYINALNSEFEVLKIKFHEKEQDYQYKYDILAEEKEQLQEKLNQAMKNKKNESERISQFENQIELLKIELSEQKKGFQEIIKQRQVEENKNCEKALEQGKVEEREFLEKQFAQTLQEYSEEIQELKNQKKQMSSKCADLMKIIELKDGVIKQLTLGQESKASKQNYYEEDQREQQSERKRVTQSQSQLKKAKLSEVGIWEKKQTMSSTMQRTLQLEQKALDLLQDSDEENEDLN